MQCVGGVVKGELEGKAGPELTCGFAVRKSFFIPRPSHTRVFHSCCKFFSMAVFGKAYVQGTDSFTTLVSFQCFHAL